MNYVSENVWNTRNRFGFHCVLFVFRCFSHYTLAEWMSAWVSERKRTKEDHTKTKVIFFSFLFFWFYILCDTRTYIDYMYYSVIWEISVVLWWSLIFFFVRFFLFGLMRYPPSLLDDLTTAENKIYATQPTKLVSERTRFPSYAIEWINCMKEEENATKIAQLALKQQQRTQKNKIK